MATTEIPTNAKERGKRRFHPGVKQRTQGQTACECGRALVFLFTSEHFRIGLEAALPSELFVQGNDSAV